MKCPKCGGSGKIPDPGYLRSLRENRGIMLREVSREMNFSPAYISDVERGNRSPNDAFIQRYLAALKSLRRH